MLQNNTASKQSATPSTEVVTKVDLAKNYLPETDRPGVFTNMARAGALAAALMVGGQTVASEQPMPEKAPPPPTPLRESLPPPRQVVDTTIANVTQMPNKPFVFTDLGDKLAPRECSAQKVGSYTFGQASRGEALRVISEGVKQLKALNGGTIPPDKDVVLSIKTANGVVVRPVNPSIITAPDDITSPVVGRAMRDPGTRSAMDALGKEVLLKVERTGEHTVDLSYVGKRRDPASVNVELVPKPTR